MKIKSVKSRDLKQINQLEQAVFKVNAFSEDLLKKFLFTSKKVLFLKLEDERHKKELIGFIIIIKDKKDTANIINFLINPKFQNRGYGTFLLKESIKKIIELKKIEKIVLNVQVNNSIALKLYEKLGFEKNPIILENYYQTAESAFLMELIINPL